MLALLLMVGGKMITEEINERIQVTAEHCAGRIYPTKFAWKNRIYFVDKVHSYWKERVSEFRLEHHLSVTTGGPDMYELIFDPQKLTWRLGRVLLEG